MVQATQDLCPPRIYRPSTLTSYSLVVERVIQAMRAHLAEPLSLDEMAEIAGLSSFHFHRMFRSITGVPPGEFLAALRLDAAKRLLLTTSVSVTDVCFDLGYASLGTFTQRFKHLIGLSPLQLRHLASEFTLPAPEPLYERYSTARSVAAARGHGVHGSITVPDTFTGPIFVALFPKPIPQGHPVACMTLPAPGHYQLGPMPDGQYYVLSAALPWSPGALTYLLPETGLLVGGNRQPVLVCDGRASAPVDLVLRPHHSADPPVLGVFPPLLRLPALREPAFVSDHAHEMRKIEEA